jgi:hypothetical protein
VRRLWIADVHANLPAFEAVVRDAGSVDEVVFPGDIVGCGPHPAACVDLLMDLDAKAVLGNHDAAILAIAEVTPTRTTPVNWDAWTFDQLSEPQLSYLAALPLQLNIDFGGIAAQVMHNPAGAPYLHPAMPDSVLAARLPALSRAVTLCGHSHRQIERDLYGHRYVCLPPVGQPRNGDTRAGYAVETDGVLEFRFVPYDIERVAADIQRIGLDDAYCRRWLNFLRTASDPDWSREYRPEVDMRHDPQSFLRENASANAALARLVCDLDPLPTDSDALGALSDDLVAHIAEHREPAHGSFQRGYAELLLKTDASLQKATVDLIEEQWRTRQKIGHYELLSALVLGYDKPEVLEPTLAEIHHHLKTWGNEGWCPFTPALWLRILWLAGEQVDAAADITAQLEYIETHLDEEGAFQYREPFCLMYCIGLMDHSEGEKMRDRFIKVIAAKQEPDGGWGDFSYIAFTMLDKWGQLSG